MFLDELPEFQRSALEALREPLENGRITIVRANHRAEFPATFQLIAAMNPCPCGFLGCHMPACRCSPDQISRYQSRLSGPLLDRIDLHVDVPALPATDLLQAPTGEASAPIRQRSSAARQRAQERQGSNNHALTGRDLDQFALLNDAAAHLLQSAASRLGWSARATQRTIRVARTIADLDMSDAIHSTHLAEAMQYRRQGSRICTPA